MFSSYSNLSYYVFMFRYREGRRPRAWVAYEVWLPDKIAHALSGGNRLSA